MNCNHDFKRISNKEHTSLNSTMFICIYCGQIRYIYDNGKIIVKREAGLIKHETEKTI